MRLRSNQRRHTATLTLTAVLAAAMLVAGCGSDANPAPSSSGSNSGAAGQKTQSIELIIPAPLGIYFPALVVAQERFWRDAGLEVKFQPTDGSSIVAQQLVAGKSKYGMMTAASVYLADVEGADLRGVSLMTHDDASLFSVPEDSAIQSVDQLKGKAIGVTSAGDGAIPLVEAVLADSGFSKGDYKLPVIGPGGPAAAQALKSGRVAAYAHGISDIGGMETVAKVKLRSIMPEKFVGLPGNVLTVRQGALDNPGDLATTAKLAKGWIDAATFLRDSPDEALKIICDSLPEQCQDQATAKAIVAKATLADGPVGSDAPGLINLEKTKTLIGTISKDAPLPLEQVFPRDALSAAG
jgi:NitT/TauT family transport system substrate-binding protein